MQLESIEINLSGSKKIKNNINYCIGTGRLGLALQNEYLKQLKLVQEQIHFKYIRGHGIFSDDIGIYHEYNDDFGNHVEFNFTYLDRIMDSFKKLKIKPFLELGFMPSQLASGDQTVFYWEGNITYPKNEQNWVKLVQVTLRHLTDRYGKDEVLTWPIEVWNEPNGLEFWVNADAKKYFKLFKLTFDAIKQVNKEFKVGGPAISGIEHEKWIKDFVDFCDTNALDVDFISRHIYASIDKKVVGHYSYFKLRDTREVAQEAGTTRSIIDQNKKFKNTPLHITEFSSIYRPDSPLHDTVKNAAYVTDLVTKMMGKATSYSYWTFGDAFEEQGVPFSQFHGGFGLVANNCIPKPTFWAFKFLNDLFETCVYKSDHSIITVKNNNYRGVIWNYTREGQSGNLRINIDLKLQSDNYCVVTNTIDKNHGNPLQIWHDLGDNPNPSEEQINLLKRSANPGIKTNKLKKGKIISIEIEPNAVVSVDVLPIQKKADRGYDFGLIESYK